MFKNNYIQKLAFDNIRKQKKFYKFIFISLVLIFALSTILSTLFSTYEEIGYREKSSHYGIWSMAVENVTNEQMDIINSIPDVNTGHIYNIGDVQYQNSHKGSMSSLDETGLQLTSLTLSKGRFPIKSDEIAIEEEQFYALNLPKTLNQDIELTIIQNEKSQTKKFKIVGIIENYSQVYPIDMSAYLTAGYTSSQSMTLFNSHNNLELWNCIVENKMVGDVIFNTSTYNDYHQFSMNDSFTISDYTLMLKYFVLILGFVGVFGTMVSSMSKRAENFTLMKALGATSKQIQKMVVYEGLLISVIASIVGILIGFVFSFSVLYSYHIVMNSEFIFVINGTFYNQLVLAIIGSLIGIFIPSFSSYHVPLTGRIEKKFNAPKVRKIRKINIFSMAIQEFLCHKLVSCLLIVVVFGGIIGGDLLAMSIDAYQDSLQYNQERQRYDYRVGVHNNQVSPSDVEALTKLQGINYQIQYQTSVQMYWDGIEKEEKALDSRTTAQFFKSETLPKYLETANINFYQNEQTMKELLKKYHMQGNYPVLDDETLIVKPYISVHDEGKRYASINRPRTDDYIKDVGLDIGDYIDVYIDGDEGISKLSSSSLKIVGVISFEDLPTKEEGLFSSEYSLIVNEDTFYKNFSNADTANMFFDVDDLGILPQFKSKLFNIINKYEDVQYYDEQASQQLFKTTAIENVLKDASFFGILLMGIVTLTYLHRKIKVVSMKREIGLFRAIGMTKKQLYKMHFLYGAIIYLSATSIYLIMWIKSLMDYKTFIEALEYIVCSGRLAVILVLGVGFILAIMVPIHSELKERIIDNISKD